MNKNAMWDEYHALLGKVSRMEDNLNVPREARVIPLFQQTLKGHKIMKSLSII